MKNNKNNKGIPSPLSGDFGNMFKTKKSILDDLYYEAMELLDGDRSKAKQAVKLLETALEMDEDYVQTYVGLVTVYTALGKSEKVEEMIRIAYEKTVKKYPKWPESLEWGFLENRAYLRSIQSMAYQYWDDNEKDKAIELFKLLLKLSPNDNQGARYEIAGLYAGLLGTDVSDMFDDGNTNQNWDTLENLLAVQNKKYKFWKDPNL